MSLGIAVIGLGHWGPNYVRVFGSMAETRMVAAVDVEASCRDRIQARYPSVACFSDIQEALDNEEVDAVVVATPTTTHYESVKASLQAGKHVLCEKPLTKSSDEAWELTRLSREMDRQLMVGHIFLFNPGIEYLKQAADDGAGGKVYYLNAVRTNLGPFRKDVNAAWDLASHDIYIFNFLLNKRPLAVAATGAGYLRKSVEDIAFITLKYPGGVIGHIHVSWLDPKKVREITMVSKERMVTWDEFGSPGPVMIHQRSVVWDRVYDTFGEFQLLRREGDVIVPCIPSGEPLARQAAAFVERCAGSGADKKGNARDGAAVVDILGGADRSLAQDGALVEIEYGG